MMSTAAAKEPPVDRIDAMTLEMRAGFAELRAGQAELRADHAEFRSTMSERFATLIDAIADLRAEYRGHTHGD
jgi:hypothetical protein